MVINKTKIRLSPEQETLLITLYAKSQPENPLFYDPEAARILAGVDYDFAGLRVPTKTVVLVCQRAKKLDAYTREFLAENPAGLVIQLGCGLDSRFSRVDDGVVRWYDLDMAPVIELRRRFFEESDRYHMIASSVTDLSWMELAQVEGRPVLVIAEGLLMYLAEADVRSLVLKLQDTYPGCRLVADVFSTLAARSAASHPSLKSTGAALGWGIDNPGELESWGPGIRLLEEWFFSQDPELSKLSFGYRLAYKLAGAFQIARRAHRVVYYQL